MNIVTAKSLIVLPEHVARRLDQEQDSKSLRRRLYGFAAIIALGSGVYSAILPLAYFSRNTTDWVLGVAWGMMGALLVYMGVLAWFRLLFFNRLGEEIE